MPMLVLGHPTAAQMYHDNARAPPPAFDPTLVDDSQEEPLELSSCMQRRLMYTLVDTPLSQQKQKLVSFSDDTEDLGPLSGLEYLGSFPDVRRSSCWKVNALELIF